MIRVEGKRLSMTQVEFKRELTKAFKEGLSYARYALGSAEQDLRRGQADVSHCVGEQLEEILEAAYVVGDDE